jgi:hypothetical protein
MAHANGEKSWASLSPPPPTTILQGDRIFKSHDLKNTKY